MAAIAVMAFVAIAFLEIPFPLIILGAAVAGALVHLVRGRAGDSTQPDMTNAARDALPEWARPSLARFAATTTIWLALWLVPLALLYAVLGQGNVFAQEASFFSRMAAVTFGGATRCSLCCAAGCRGSRLAAAGGNADRARVGETTPGPLILVLVFVGFMGGARLSGLDMLAGGVLGAVVTLWFTFVPCFLWIFAGAPFMETVRSVRWLASALAAVTAAVVGVIANLALWFAIHVLFAEVGEAAIGPFTYPVPDLPSIDIAALIIAAASAIALLRFHANLSWFLQARRLSALRWAPASREPGSVEQAETDSSVAVRDRLADQVGDRDHPYVDLRRSMSAGWNLDTSSVSREPVMRATAPPDRTPQRCKVATLCAVGEQSLGCVTACRPNRRCRRSAGSPCQNIADDVHDFGLPGRSRRLSTIASCASSRLASARARTTPPTSGDTTQTLASL